MYGDDNIDPGFELTAPPVEAELAVKPKHHYRFLLSMLAVAGGATAYIRGPLQRRKLFLPERYPAGDWNPQARGLPAQDQWFDSSEGVRLHGWWIPRATDEVSSEPQDPSITLLYCHGHSGCLGRRLDVIRMLYDLPANVFAFDYRGYGRSTGKPSAAGLYADARAAAKHLRDVLGQPAHQIVLFGHSLGAALALEAALSMQADEPAAGLVLESGFTSVHDVTRQRYPLIPLHLLTRDPFRNIDRVTQVECPILFIHGSEDTVMPAWHSERLWQTVSGQTVSGQPVRGQQLRGSRDQLYLVPGAGHNDLHTVGGSEYSRRLHAFALSSIDARREGRAQRSG